MKKIIFIIEGALVFIAISIGYITFLIPTPKIEKSNNLQIYDLNNNLIYEEVYEVKSSYIELEKLPDYVGKSFIAIEDKNFFNHNGFDLKRIIQSFFINLISLRIKQGASTISQQYARNVLLTNKRTWLRKIKEAFYTMKIERKYTKEQILEGYLNSLYFGHGIIGIDGASRYYFNKGAENLTLSESTILSGLCNAPSIYSPSINPENTRLRQELVIFKMYEEGYISKELYYQTINESVDYYLSKQENDNLSYYKDSIIKELINLGLYTDKAKLMGMKVMANIDFSINETVNQIIKKHQTYNKDLQVSAIIMKPFSNKILSLIGGFDYEESPFNRAINSSRSIGSTIKPLIYYLALVNGFNPTTTLKSEEVNFFIKDYGIYSPRNPNDKYANDEIDMIKAIALSDNIYAAKTLLLLGSSSLKELIEKFSISVEEALPTIALGNVKMSLLQLTSIYNTLASLGDYYKPSFVNLVLDSNEKIIYENNSSKKTLLKQDETIMINQMMTSVFSSNLSDYLSATLANYPPNNLYAAKTGTTSSDSYVMAFNPNYTIGIWVGSDSGEELKNYTLSKIIFKEITNYLDSITKQSWYATNSRLVAARYDANTRTFSSNGDIYYFKR